MTQEMSLDQFRFTDRLRLAWALAWPCAILGLIYSLARGRLGLPDGSMAIEWIDFAAGVLQFFLFSTWVVRRAMRLDYSTFRVVVIRGSAGERARAMNYPESLSVTWLLIWRTDLIECLVLGVFLAVLWIVRGTHPAGLSPFSLISQSLGFVLEVLIFSLILKAAIRKKYSGFSLGLEEVGAPSEEAASPNSPR